MKKYVKENKIINATDKAYRLLYEPIGFKLYKSKNMTITEIKEKLDELEIDYTSRETKDELLEKLDKA